jgi:hypothetical protein
MRSNLKSDAAMRNPTAPGQPPASGNGYAPSVPISVYRELAAELQATKTLLDSLNTQNQQLTHQNQQLRQEVERVVQSALNMRQVADSFQPNNLNTPQPHPEFVAEPSRPARAPQRQPRPESNVPKPKPVDSQILSDALFTEEPEIRHRPQSRPAEAPKEMGGLWLILIILAIVITAFGAGFLVVRPLLPSSR